MGKALIAFDEDISKVLATKVNKSEFVREAVRVYIEGISTDTLGRMQEAFRRLQADTGELKELTLSLYTITEQLNNTIEELKNR